MKHDDPTRPDRLNTRTLPDGTPAQPPSEPAANPVQGPDGDARSNEPPAQGEKRDKNFWRFDFHTIPPDLSRELATAQLPPVREEQLYHSHAWAEKSEPRTEAPRLVSIAALVVRVRAWFSRPWHLRERRTQITLALCVGCLLLFVIAVGVRPGDRAHTVQPGVEATQVHAASPATGDKPGSQALSSTAAGSAPRTNTSARQSPRPAPEVSSTRSSGAPDVRAAPRPSTPAPVVSAKPIPAREQPQTDQDVFVRPPPPEVNQTPEFSSGELAKSPTPSGSASSAPKQRFLIKSR